MCEKNVFAKQSQKLVYANDFWRVGVSQPRPNRQFLYISSSFFLATYRTVVCDISGKEPQPHPVGPFPLAIKVKQYILCHIRKRRSHSLVQKPWSVVPVESPPDQDGTLPPDYCGLRAVLV